MTTLIYAIVHDITESKRVADALKTSKDNLRAILDATQESIYMFDRDGLILETNNTALQRLKLTREEIIGRNFKDFIPLDLQQQRYNHLTEVFSTGKPVYFEDNREDYFFEHSFFPVYENNKVSCVVSYSRDVTEIRKNQQALSEIEDRFRLALKNSPVSIAIQDKNFVYNWAYNQSTRQTDEIIGKTDFDLFDPEEIPFIMEIKRRVLESGTEEHVQTWLSSNGQRVFLDLYYEPVKNKYGEIIGIGTAVVNLTNQKLAEEALYKYIKAQEALSDASTNLLEEKIYSEIVQFAVEQIHQMAGDSLVTLNEYDVKTEMITTLASVGTDHKVAKFEALLGIQLTGSSFQVDKELWKPMLKSNFTQVEGGFYDLTFRSVPVEMCHRIETELELKAYYVMPLMVEDNLMGTVVICAGYPTELQNKSLIESFIKQISLALKNKQVEEELRNSERRLEAVFNGVTETIMLMDIHGKVLTANQTAANRWGMTIETIKDYNGFEYIHPDLRKKREMQIREMIVTRLPIRFEEKNNDIIYDLTFYPIVEPTGEINQFVIFNRDITEKKKAERALLVSEEKYRSLVMDMQVGVLLQGPQAEILMSNPRALELLGLSEDQLLGKTSFDPDWNVIHEDGSPFPGETHPVAVTIATGLPVKDVVMGVYNPTTNNRLWLLVHAVPEFGFDGKLRQVVCTFIDISDLKKAEKAIKESEEKFRNLVYDMEVGVLLNSPKSEIILANPTALKLLGLTEEQITGKTPFDPDWRPIHEDGSPFPGETHPASVVIATKKAVKNVVMGIYQPLRGEHAWFLINAQPQLDVNGALIQIVTTFVEITDLKEAQRELKESELRLKYHFENSPLAVVEWDNDFFVTQWSVEAERMFGWTKEETIGKRIDTLNLIYEEDIPVVDNTMERLTSGEEDKVVSTNRNITKSGELKTCIWYNSILFDENGQMASVMSLVQDITLERVTMDALKLSESRLDAVFNSVTESITLMDVEGNILSANQTAAVRFGLTVNELVGRNIFSLIPPEAKKKRVAQIQEMITTGLPVKFEDYREGIEYDLTFYPISESKGNIKQFVEFNRDVTESKKAREELRKNEERYSMIYNSSRDSIFSFDLTGKMTGVNRSFCEEVNLEMSAIVGHTLMELQLSQFLGFEQQKLTQQVIKANKSITTELKIPANDKSIRYFEVILNPMHDEKGKIVGIGGSARNITRRKEADQALQESEKRFRYLVKDMPVGVILFDSKGRVVMSNPKATELLGVNEKEVKGKYNTDDNWDVIHEDGSFFPEQERPIHLSFATGEPVRGVVVGVYRQATFDYVWLLIDTVVILKEDGSIRNVIGTFIDITERKAKEEALRKLNKTLSALGNSSLAMAQAKNEEDYLKKVCNIVVEETDFTMAWIGYAEEDEAKTIRPVAYAGFNDDYLDNIKLSWADNEFGRGPTGVAIRTGRVSMCKNMQNDPTFGPWREEALKRGYASSVVFPLISGDKIFGAITIYSKEQDSFLEDEIQLLSKLASDLSHGITTIRLQLAHDQAEEALVRSHSELESTVKERTAELIMTYEALKQTEEKYRTVADFATNWEFWTGLEDEMIYCSPSCERITGYSSTEFVMNSQLIYSIIHPDDLKMFLEHKKKELLAEVCDHEVQYRILKKDGVVRWIGHFCQPVFDENGRFSGVRGSNKDITSRKKMEELLTVSNQKYKMLSENINDGIFICKKGRFEYFNQSIIDIFGFHGHELQHMKLTQLVNTDYHEELEKFLYTNSLRNQSCNIEVECLKKDLSTVFVEIFLNYVAKDNTVYGVLHDITEKKEFQKNMVKAIIQTEEKERSHFSKELHDGLGPLLSTIKLYLQWSERPNSNKSREEIIGKAGEILEEALGTVKEISNKLSPHLLTNYGLNSAIRSFVDKLSATEKFNIELESNIERRIDPETEAALYRAMIECINNTLKYAHANNIYINMTDNGNQIQISYKDDGIGFDIAETMAKHKGLGLFNLQNRLHTIGGKVDLISEPGKGVNYLFTVNI